MKAAKGAVDPSWTLNPGVLELIRRTSAVLPPDSEESLMREELSILGRDSVFDRVLG